MTQICMCKVHTLMLTLSIVHSSLDVLTFMASTAILSYMTPKSIPLRLSSCSFNCVQPGWLSAATSTSVFKARFATPVYRLPFFFYWQQKAISSLSGRLMWIKAHFIKMRLVVSNSKRAEPGKDQVKNPGPIIFQFILLTFIMCLQGTRSTYQCSKSSFVLTSPSFPISRNQLLLILP